MPTANSDVAGMTSGPDGAIWFTENVAGKIGRITTAGTITEFPMRFGPGRQPSGIVAGPDNNLWFCADNDIWQITTGGVQTLFPFTGIPRDITVGADGNLWFTILGSNNIGRITTAGVITLFPVPFQAQQIVAGPDGALYFSEIKLGRITTDGSVTEIGGFTGSPFSLAVGPDRNIWAIEIINRRVARVLIPGGTIPPAAAPAMSGWGCGVLAILIMLVAWHAGRRRYA